MERRIAAGLVVCCFLAGCTADKSISLQRAVDLARGQMPGGQVDGAVVRIADGASVPGMPAGYYFTLKSSDGTRKGFHVSADGREVREVTTGSEQVRKDEATVAADTAELAPLAQAAREQAARVPSIAPQRLHEERYALLEDGREAARAIEVLGNPRFPDALQVRNANAILLISDLRPTPAPRDVLVAFQEQPSQGRQDAHAMLLRVPAARDQYLLVDGDYVVYPPGVTGVEGTGPFLTLVVAVTEGGAACPGISVALTRGTKARQATTNDEGYASFELEGVGSEDLTVAASRQGSTRVWTSRVQTYLRGARPGLVVYSVNAALPGR